MNCPNCHREITDLNVKFCPGCGLCLAYAQTPHCPKCHREITEDNTKFCPECGCSIESAKQSDFSSVSSIPAGVPHAQPYAPIYVVQNPRKPMSPLLVMAIILMVLGVGCGIAALIVYTSTGMLEYYYGGGEETTVTLGVIGGALLLIGFIMMLVAKCSRRYSSLSYSEEISKEPVEFKRANFYGVCERCGVESKRLVRRKVDDVVGWQDLCEACADGNTCTGPCEICGKRSKRLQHEYIPSTASHMDVCPSCANLYKQK